MTDISNKYITMDIPSDIIKKIILKNIFLTGPPGSGKTWITQQYIEYCYKTYNINQIGITASTGIASKLLNINKNVNHMTIHSWSGIDIVESSDTFEKILKRVMGKPYHVKRWRNAKILIIDEISLLDNKIFEFLDKIGKYIRNSLKPFGGIRLLVVGDFYQLPPVNGTFAFISENNIWENTFDFFINLKTSYRSSDNNLNKILKTIRKGNKLLPNMIKALKKRNSKKVLATVRYPILVPLRDMARNINNKKMSENDSKEYKFIATYNNDLLKKIICSNSPLEDELILKVGCPVIYLINDYSKGLVNGMVGTVVDFINNKPIVKFDNIEHIVERHKWDKKDNTKIYTMDQFPLLLAYAITIHRSQGQTLSQASIVLDSRIWEKSQSYVALSRLKSLDGLNLLEFDPNVFNIKRHNDQIVKDYYNKWT